jgi:hypothetical protein
MNVALWLEGAGKSHAASRAVALGERVVLDYGTLATRVAAALRATARRPKRS